MSLRGFSSFEAKFRSQMAKAVPKEVMIANQVKEGLTKEEIGEYQETFKKFDMDHGGTIDTNELGNLVRVLGLNPSDQEIEILKKEIDLDGSGEIEFKEFLTLMNSKTLRYKLFNLFT